MEGSSEFCGKNDFGRFQAAKIGYIRKDKQKINRKGALPSLEKSVAAALNGRRWLLLCQRIRWEDRSS